MSSCRATNAKAERSRDFLRKDAEALAQSHDTSTTLALEVAELRARLARYEAPGPALLTAGSLDPVTAHDVPGTPDDPGVSLCRCYDCTVERIDAAYREQHARCVAVVERLLREHNWSESAGLIGGLRMARAALTGEAEK